MRIIIAAATWKSSWGSYLEVPPHLAPVHGGPLLAQTVRQALAHSTNVLVTIPDDERYAAAAEGATVHVRTGSYLSEYDSTRDLWSESGRTVLLYGDVYWTDAAIDTVAAYELRQYRCFGRFGPSRITRCSYGEVFGASWWPEQHEQMDKYLGDIEVIRERGEITRPTAWMLLRAWQGTPLDEHEVDTDWFAEINDYTEDFDYPRDYERHPVVREDRRIQRRAGKR